MDCRVAIKVGINSFVLTFGRRNIAVKRLIVFLSPGATTTRRQSEVVVGVHVRAEAAYRRQRMAREMEQTAVMRAHLEVEKAKIRKGSIDCGRRPSRPLANLYEEPEPGERFCTPRKIVKFY